MLFGEARQHRDDRAHRERRRQPDPQHARQLPGAAQFVLRLHQLVEQGLDAFEVARAGLRERQRARAAREQRRAEFLLERSDRARRGGLRNLEFARGAREAAGAGDAHEQAQGGEAVVHVASTMAHAMHAAFRAMPLVVQSRFLPPSRRP